MADPRRYTLIEYMPAHLRSLHVAAGNRGIYPYNGAERCYVERDSVSAHELHPTWAEVLEDGIHHADIDQGLPVYDCIPDDALPPYTDPDDREWDDPNMGGRDYGR